jgi:hypothetical protein
MAKLTEAMKRSIVTHLAEFSTQSETARLVSEEFGVQIERYQVRTLDPTSMRFKGSPRWRALFESTRAAFVSEVAQIPIAHQGYRLGMLQRQLDDIRHAGNPRLLMQILAQAAKEVGGMYKGARICLQDAMMDHRS